jgi:hypothetical protein
MMLMDKGGRRRHISRGAMYVWSVDVPDDVHISITFCTSRSACSPCHTERVHCGFGFVLLNQVEPAKLKSLIDSNTEFYVMSGSAELQMEFDQGPLTANLQGGYSIVSDPRLRSNR